jgi:hypothetical protein
MKVTSFVLLLSLAQLFSNAQNTGTDYFKTAPKLTATRLIRKDGLYLFNAEKWQAVANKELWLELFAIENGKLWTGQMVGTVRLAGYWKISEKAVGYMYAAYIENDMGTFTPSIFISSFNIETNSKGIDVDPFSQAPSPTGLRGKIVVTQTLTTTASGLFTIINKHQSPAKLLSKTVKYIIGEDGAVEVQ